MEAFEVRQPVFLYQHLSHWITLEFQRNGQLVPLSWIIFWRHLYFCLTGVLCCSLIALLPCATSQTFSKYPVVLILHCSCVCMWRGWGGRERVFVHGLSGNTVQYSPQWSSLLSKWLSKALINNLGIHSNFYHFLKRCHFLGPPWD